MPDAVSIKTFFLAYRGTIVDYLWSAVEESRQRGVDIVKTKAVAELVKVLEENHLEELEEIRDHYGKYKKAFASVKEMVHSGVDWYVNEYDMLNTCRE